MLERKILTIDDDQDINNFLKVIFKKHDYQLETSSTMEEFFKKVVSFKPSLCLIDLNIGDFNGIGYKIIEMIRRKIGNEIIIIVMSRRNSNEDIALSLECGANDYIQKPIDDKILISKINLYLEKDSPENNFPFYAVPAGDMECNFDIPLKIHSLAEDEIIIFSKNYIGKGTYLTVQNGLLKGYKFSIKDVSLDREAGGHLLRIELDENQHAALFPTIRKIMLMNPPRD